MKEPTRSTRPPLFERLKSGMEDLIADARGEIELKTTVREMPDLDKYKPDGGKTMTLTLELTPDIETRCLTNIDAYGR